MAFFAILGLGEKMNQRAMTLSGGMKRRLMIARALVHQPKFLVLDEPTAGVDVELRRGMWDYLRGLTRSGLTILLTTHYLEEAEQLCKHVAIINKGEIVANGTMEEILAMGGGAVQEGGYKAGRLEEVFISLVSDKKAEEAK
jgi:ABC-2 type transport system ATP-binding protein